MSPGSMNPETFNASHYSIWSEGIVCTCIACICMSVTVIHCGVNATLVKQLMTFHLSSVAVTSSVAMTTTSVCPRRGCVTG